MPNPNPARPIKRRAETPVYQQIADYLRDDITRGAYPHGDPLPSETQIADDYGVTDKTARKAVAVLIGEGRARIVRGKGAFAVDPPQPVEAAS